MVSLMRNELCCSSAPEFLPSLAIKTENHELITRIRELDSEDAIRLVFRLGQRRIHLAGVDGGEDGGRRNFDPESIFAERDKDKDGFLSGDEISERMRTRMAAIDEDKDGAISKDEFLAAMRRSRSSRQGRGGDAPLGDENE